MRNPYREFDGNRLAESLLKRAPVNDCCGCGLAPTYARIPSDLLHAVATKLKALEANIAEVRRDA